MNKPTIVLVRPQLPENIGMIARVMNNFSLKELILVNPRQNWLNDKSINSAKKAINLINKVKIYDNLDQALENFTYVISTTNRSRYLNKNETSDFSELNEIFKTSHKVAILFGPENSGLSNDDLRLSNIIFSINTQNNSNSLNLSHAVAIICHKIFESSKPSIKRIKIKKSDFADKRQISKYLDFLFQSLSSKNFFVPPEKTKSMKNNIYNIYSKFPYTKKELKTLWGITKKLIK